jgi:hypothetical protein
MLRNGSRARSDAAERLTHSQARKTLQSQGVRAFLSVFSKRMSQIARAARAARVQCGLGATAVRSAA